MKFNTKQLGFVGILFALITPQLAQGQRERIRLDSDWRFHLGDEPGYNGAQIAKWQWQLAPEGANTRFELLEGHWQDAMPGQDVFRQKPGFAWYKTVLPNLPKPGRTFHFQGVDDNATVYLNGKFLLKHVGWGNPFDVPLDAAWNPNGENLLTVLVENTAGAGGISETTIQSQLPETVETKGPTAVFYNDSDWRRVHLPHDFVVEGEFTPKGDVSHGSLLGNVGWYRQKFTLPKEDEGKSLWIDFDGVYRNSEVWINGHYLGKHPSGYIGFRYDITKFANYDGNNTLTVRADARSFEGWWYEGGGIYRHVWLNKANASHLESDSVFVTTALSENNLTEAKLSIAQAFHLEKNGSTAVAESASVLTEIVDPSGKIVESFETPKATIIGEGEETIVSTRILKNPKLWSVETPNLYHAILRLKHNGKVVDMVTKTFGVRTVRFDVAQGLFISGKSVKIQGTCNHQDFAGVGVALSDNLLEWRIRKLKEMGSNAYRCSHNPPAAELLDACDRLGMIVMDETRNLGDYAGGAKTPPGTKYDDLSDLKAMIIRDRNHSSIIMWSMCNEEPLQGSPEGGKIFDAMRKATLALDPTRPVTAAMNGGWGGGFSLYQDVQGVNYNVGVYDSVHQALPNEPMYGSETASEVGTRGEYVNDSVKGYVSAYSVNAPPWAQTSEVAWKALAERPFMAGGYVWTGFDYKGEPTPYGWPCINSHFGIMDMCGFPKDAYYYYRSWWGSKPVVHVFPHWNWEDKPGQPIEVWVHSNADHVELFLNGKSLGAKAMPQWSHLEWKVPYTPGRLEAKGYLKAGKLIASDFVETTGKPTQIRLSSSVKSLKPNGEDVAVVTVSLLDEKGRVVPDAENAVMFEVMGAGTLAGVGNGDPSSHEPDKANGRKAFHGLCLALLQAGERGGQITLRATSLGLASAIIKIGVSIR